MDDSATRFFQMDWANCAQRDAFAYPDSLGDTKKWYMDIPAVNHDRNFSVEQFRTGDAMSWT